MNGIFKFLKTFNDFINLKSVIFTAVNRGMIAIIIAIIFLVIFRKMILVKRKYVVLTVFSYIYLVFIPLFFGFTSFSYYGINSIQKQIVKNLPNFLSNNETGLGAKSKDIIINRFGEDEINITLGEFLDDIEKNSKKEFINQKIKHDWANGNKVDAILNYLILNRPDILRKTFVTLANKSLGNDLISKNTANNFLDIKIADLFTDGIVVKIIESMLVSTISGFKKKILIIFFLVMALPLAEIIWSNKERKKLLKQNNEVN